MSPLFETICLKDGVLLHLPYHQERLNRSRMLLFVKSDFIDLEKAISVPTYCLKGIWKCRVTYAEDILKVEFIEYISKPVRCLTCVIGDAIDYTHKYVERASIYSLMANIYTDDILIIKNGLVTDTSMANIALYDGKKWITPAAPLLAGTTRARLLKEEKIVADEITLKDLPKFKKSTLFNAMCSHTIPISNILFS